MDDITESAVFKLHRVTALIDRIADDYLASAHGIRYAPFLVLLMAHVLGPTSQQRIAANLGVSRASITQRVGGLVEQGLLAVEPDPADARANHFWARCKAPKPQLSRPVKARLEVRQTKRKSFICQQITLCELKLSKIKK